MKNPGALAGATGANVKADKLQNRAYTAPSIFARRVDTGGNWNRDRFRWLEEVSCDDRLSPMARLVATRLVLQFSHHETAHCAPGNDTLAAALGTSADTIKRALRDLAQAGWIIRTEGRGRGNRALIYFLGRSNVVPLVRAKGAEVARPAPSSLQSTDSAPREKGGNPAPVSEREAQPEKGAYLPAKGGKSAPSYNKADPKKNQRAANASGRTQTRHHPGRIDWTAYDRAAAGNWPSDRAMEAIEPGSYREAAWNEWLASSGFPDLAGIAQRDKAGRWLVPFRMPPGRGARCIVHDLSEKWARVFTPKAKATHHA